MISLNSVNGVVFNCFDGKCYLTYEMGNSTLEKVFYSCNVNETGFLSNMALLMFLISYDLVSVNEEIYNSLVSGVIKTGPEAICEEVLRYTELPIGIKKLLNDDRIYEVIKNDLVCRYLYFENDIIKSVSYHDLRMDKNLEDKLEKKAYEDIIERKVIDRYNYMGISFCSYEQLLRVRFSRDCDLELEKYFLEREIEVSKWQSLALRLVECPRTFISITSEEFRLEYYGEYIRANPRKNDILLLYKSLSDSSREKYSNYFKSFMFTALELEIENKKEVSLEQTFTDEEKNFLDEMDKLPLCWVIVKLKELKKTESGQLILSNPKIIRELVKRDRRLIKYFLFDDKLLKSTEYVLTNKDLILKLKEKTGIEIIEDNGIVRLYSGTALYGFNYLSNQWTPSGGCLEGLNKKYDDELRKEKQLQNKKIIFEYLFIKYGRLLEKVYKKYYGQYKKYLGKYAKLKELVFDEVLEKNDNFLGFLNYLFGNDKKFEQLYNDSEIDTFTFEIMFKMVKLLLSKKEEELEQRWNQKEMLEKVKYNVLAVKVSEEERRIRTKQAELNGTDFIDINFVFGEDKIKNGGLLQEIMQIKLLDSSLKGNMFKWLLRGRYILGVEDINFILSRVKEWNMSLNDVLNFYKINNKVFYRIYMNSASLSPEFLNVVAKSFEKYGVDNNLVILNLACRIINEGYRSEGDFKKAYPDFDLDILCKMLKGMGASAIRDALDEMIVNWKNVSRKVLTEDSKV